MLPALLASGPLRRSLRVAATAWIVAASQPAPAAHPAIELQPLGTFSTGVFGDGAAEIVAHDPGLQRLFVTSVHHAGVQVVDVRDPATPTLVTTLDVTPYGAVPNSVAVRSGVVAVAVEAPVKTDPGSVVFFDTHGTFLSRVTVGALPDMLTFTPDGRYVLVANEGEPNDAYTVDPEGSVSVIDVSRGADQVTQADVRTAGFSAFNGATLHPSIRIFGPGATVAQDLEPEFIAVSHDSRLAWVTLQENNALGILHVPSATFLALRGLGFKDHSRPANGLDASNQDGAINIQPWPVHGIYMPDSVATYRSGGKTYLVMANEGDSRSYPGFDEEARVRDLVLDPVAFPNASVLQASSALGRLKVTRANGDDDGDGDFDRLFSFGARSFSIRTVTGQLVYDSADDLEQITAAALPADFNSDEDANGSFDQRSDDKGPEPEGVALGRVEGRTYAFVGLERIGGVMVYDVSDPFHVAFVQYINTRDFTGDPEAGTAGDLAPEGLLFIEADDSPTHTPLLAIACEVSGTTTLFEIGMRR